MPKTRKKKGWKKTPLPPSLPRPRPPSLRPLPPPRLPAISTLLLLYPLPFQKEEGEGREGGREEGGEGGSSSSGVRVGVSDD